MPIRLDKRNLCVIEFVAYAAFLKISCASPSLWASAGAICYVVLYARASMTFRRLAVYRRVDRDDADVCGLGFAAGRGIDVWGFEPPFFSMPSFRFAIGTIPLS